MKVQICFSANQSYKYEVLHMMKRTCSAQPLGQKKWADFSGRDGHQKL
jgi:hypothetical protein